MGSSGRGTGLQRKTSKVEMEAKADVGLNVAVRLPAFSFYELPGYPGGPRGIVAGLNKTRVLFVA